MFREELQTVIEQLAASLVASRKIAQTAREESRHTTPTKAQRARNLSVYHEGEVAAYRDALEKLAALQETATNAEARREKEIKDFHKQVAEEAETCTECGALIPDTDEGLISKSHQSYCSCYPEETFGES